MNRRKLSCILTVTMIATQLNSVAFAQKNYDQINDISSFVIDEVQNDAEQEENNLTEDNSVELEKNESSNEETTVKEDENSETIIQKDESSEGEVIEDNTSDINVKSVGKIELDMNFHMPIKNVGKDATNISVKLLKGDQEIGKVELGNDNKQGNINGSTYNLQAMDGKRIAISDDAEELSFYHLTFNNLELGSYSIEIEGKGYTTASIKDIQIDNSSKRVKVGTSDNKIVLSDSGTPNDESDDTVEYYPGVFLAGDVDGNKTITKEDYEEVKTAIKDKNNDLKYDINKDSKVDITDLTYIHKNIDKEKKNAEIVATDAIIDTSKVDITLDESKVELGQGQNIKNILVGDGSKVSLSTKSVDGAEAPEISEENPIRIPITLSSISSYSSDSNNTSMEKVVIKAPSQTRPTSGSVVINNETYNYDESNVNKSVARTTAGEEIDEIVIDLGKQVAVSEITINVTGSRGSKNLAEITKVEFLNNVYKEMPKPNMNIPVINNFTSTTSVGNESMTIGWDHEANVTGYEIKVETLKDDGTVESTKLYRTSENTLKITQVKPYGIYRFSIQSINGSEWSSGYKDQQDDYNKSTTGSSNLETNVNDKDGIPDNVDTNYLPKAWDSNSGVLDSASNEEIENPNYFGADSIVELQVVPETKPEGPEGIKVSGVYKGLKVSWKAHQKAKDYDLYYRKVGDAAWIKANKCTG